MRFDRVAILVAVAVSIGWATAASAVQLTLSGNERLHFVTDGQPGTPWSTGGLGVNGNVSYNSLSSGTDPGLLTVTGEIPELDYFDPTDITCPTASTNCTFNFAQDLTFTLLAEFDSIDIMPVGGTIVSVTANFRSLGGGAPDMMLIDPSDGTTLLEAEWLAGTFGGQMTTGLSTSVFYDTASGTLFGDPNNINTIGFSQIDPASAYASLFQDGSSYIRLDLSMFFDFVPDLATIVGTAVATGELPSFTGEGQGQIFRVPDGEFMPLPEPSSVVLLSLAVAATAVARRRRDHR